MAIHVATSLGAMATDHLWTAQLAVTASGLLLCAGTINANGTANAVIGLGYYSYPVPLTLPGLIDGGALDGTSCTLTVELWTAAFGALVDGPFTRAGILWDAVSGLWNQVLNTAYGSTAGGAATFKNQP